MNLFDSNVVIAVDYDGVLTDSKFPSDSCSIRTDRIRRLKAIQKNAIIVLWTCRSGDGLIQAVNSLEQHDFIPDYVNEYPFRPYARKINADIYIDDRNLTFFGFMGLKHKIKKARKENNKLKDEEKKKCTM